MIKTTAYNNAENYHASNLNMEEFHTPESAVYSSVSGEVMEHTPVPYCFDAPEEIAANFTEIDRLILETVAMGKYVSSLQLYQFLNLRGTPISRAALRRHLQTLMKKHVIQEHSIIAPGHTLALRCYELDGAGRILCGQYDVFFHKGNELISYRRRQSLGIPPASPTDVKRILAANQILISLLISDIPLKRIGVMETFRGLNFEGDSMIRTACNATIDDETVLAYEIVRDEPEKYQALAEKITRYYKLTANTNYLQNNYHGHHGYPQLVLCGESYDHNKKIRSYLEEQGLWTEDSPILFTEDLLNFKGSDISLYTLDQYDTRNWWVFAG